MPHFASDVLHFASDVSHFLSDVSHFASDVSHFPSDVLHFVGCVPVSMLRAKLKFSPIKINCFFKFILLTSIVKY